MSLPDPAASPAEPPPAGPPAAAPRRRRRSSEEVADLILDAAAVEFEAGGFAGATTAAIARRAGVTEAQIFRFWPTKQHLFRAAIFKPLNEHFARFHARHTVPPGDELSMREAARVYITELQDFMEQHARMLMSLIVADAYSPGTTGGVADMGGLADYFAMGTRIMESRVGTDLPVDAALMVRVSFAAVLANVLFKDWLFPRGLASEQAIRDAVIEFVIDGIRANER